MLLNLHLAEFLLLETCGGAWFDGLFSSCFEQFRGSGEEICVQVDN